MRILYCLVLLAIPLSIENPQSFYNHKLTACVHTVFRKGEYFILADTFQMTSLFARFCGEVITKLPIQTELGQDFLVLARICQRMASYSYQQVLHYTYQPSRQSWETNQHFLSQCLPASSEETKLLSFLKHHWLSKNTGFPTLFTDLCAPFIKAPFQINPDTALSYVRFLSIKAKTYCLIEAAWKKKLPQPEEFPLLLTRPYCVQEYFPSYLKLESYEKIKELIAKIPDTVSPVILDLSVLFQGLHTRP